MALKALVQNARQWLASGMGSTVVGTLAAACGTCIYILPQGVFLDQCVQVFQLHKHGDPASLPVSLEKKGVEVLEGTDLIPQHKKLIKFFHVYGYDVFHLGSVRTKWGAAIGIPKNFLCERPEDIAQHDIELEIRQSPHFSWDSKAGEDIMKSVVLSNDAQKFAIAREIYTSSYPTLLVRGVSTSIVIAFSFLLSKWGNRKFQLLRRSFQTRALWYAVTGTLGLGIWISLQDMYTVYLDRKCDLLASNLGPEYLNGGIEFYQKKMLMNRSLRSIMGSEANSCYTVHGNNYSMFRIKTMPLSQRLDALMKLQMEKNDGIVTH